ncbi:MAG: Asr1405/Asl0597 family protein [Prochlorotrichaceae cyanobacterium]|jgi:hypothetical protein
MPYSNWNLSAGSAQAAIDIVTRWNIYHRLQELEISCQCQCGQPLQVDCKTPLEILQFQRVLYRLTASRQDCLATLEHCWTLPS